MFLDLRRTFEVSEVFRDIFQQLLRNDFDRMLLYPFHVHITRHGKRLGGRWASRRRRLEWRTCSVIEPMLNGRVAIRPSVTGRTIMIHARHVLTEFIFRWRTRGVARHVRQIIPPIDAILSFVHKNPSVDWPWRSGINQISGFQINRIQRSPWTYARS